jgi:hypothetical protein
MGLLPPMLRLLAELHRDAGLEGPVVTLGNQDVYSDVAGLRALFHQTSCPWREPILVEPHTSALFSQTYGERARNYVHARTLFSMLGIDDYADIDAYDFDRPAIVHDLNEPLPPNLQARFGLVIDGGTLEHIFDLRTCFANVVALTRLGGRVVHCNSASNMIDHGFWAINPSAYFDYYSVNGFDELDATIFEWDVRDPWRPCSAFAYEYGMTINGRCDPERVAMTWFTARKARQTPLTLPTQGLYQVGREVAFSGGAWSPSDAPPLPRRVL